MKPWSVTVTNSTKTIYKHYLIVTVIVLTEFNQHILTS